jgi:hypothetical protein
MCVFPTRKKRKHMCFENYGFKSCLWKCWNICHIIKAHFTLGVEGWKKNSFDLSSVSFPLVEFVNDVRGFYFFYLKYDDEKHKNYKNLMSTPSMVVWHLGVKKQRWEKEWSQEKKMKARYERLRHQFLLNGLTCVLIDPKQIIYY